LEEARRSGAAAAYWNRGIGHNAAAPEPERDPHPYLTNLRITQSELFMRCPFPR